MPENAEAASVRKTALNRIHREMGAKMVEFNGWDMPVEYPATATRKSGGLVSEHLAVRNSVGIFDVSHMGDIRIVGPQALAAVQKMTMNDASKLAIGQAQYSALLYPEGTFVDDVIVHRLDENDYLLVINAGTREKDYDWVSGQAKGFECVVQNLSDDYTQIAIQGPNAWRVLQKLTDIDLTQVKFYWFTHGSVCGLPNTMVARTGYTAEDGFEIYVPADQEISESVWNTVMEAGEEFNILPCGLGARNTLRLEGALSLYGHEISDSITALEAGLTRFLKLEKGYFTGRDALEKQNADGLKRTLVGLEAIDRGIPRDGYKVCEPEGHEIGFVTSGSPAPFLKKNIALAYVPPKFASPDSILAVEIRGQLVKCKVVPIPFYRRPKASK